MYLKQLDIEGYKNFRSPFSIAFSNALSVIVGENGSGKTAIIDAVRLLLLEDEFGRSPESDSDFNLPFTITMDKTSSISFGVAQILLFRPHFFSES